MIPENRTMTRIQTIKAPESTVTSDSNLLQWNVFHSAGSGHRRKEIVLVYENLGVSTGLGRRNENFALITGNFRNLLELVDIRYTLIKIAIKSSTFCS